MEIKKIYIDMDGVLADFDAAFKTRNKITPDEYEEQFGSTKFWETIYENPRFFVELPETSWFPDILSMCGLICPQVIILSKPARVNTALCMIQKREWIDLRLGEHFPAIFEKNKEKYSGPGRLLIDDRLDNCKSWESKGGIAIHLDSWDRVEPILFDMIATTSGNDRYN